MSDGESDEGRRAVKKRKASRACDRCNSQHQPCDNAVPKCSVCVRAGTDCTYNRPVRKRGPRSGYTGQNGERLWAVVLQARPDIEDVVLQVLRGGTFAATGISNLEYYRNTDNQAELVNKFNESRIGRFLQHGESPDLNLPPLDQEFPLIRGTERPRNEPDFERNSNARRPSSVTPTASNQRDQTSSSSPRANSAIINPHGAPQNPSDIYLQSEDIRRRVFDPPQDQLRRSYSSHSRQGSPILQGAAFGPDNSVSDYHGPKPHISDMETPGNLNDFGPLPSLPRTSSQPGERNGVEREFVDLEAAYQTRWLEAVPKDTLLNLGFAPGEGMEEDFFELCANPDPIDSTPTDLTADKDEDEEVIWRRLVMKGRFV
ncbi:putative quinic acid utilization activator [Rosellinia necatrix]|uniref:Putative quinic acid utilization activator n=1 Tax=Rosellinia necatrix TaxID=77044 RepID=A0A1W2TTR0_ROSNE|nr:putative quinic acid utilization activator [Rosellinia necatrix]